MSDKDEIFRWLDSVFKEGLPIEVKALYINLVECRSDLDIELFGVGEFDHYDEDWACDDIFQAASLEIKNVMENPNDWEKVLQDISIVISGYVDINGDRRGIANVARVGVGFGDSEIILVKNEI